MSIAPSFATAPRLRIKAGDSIIAYAVGMDIRFSVQIAPVTVIGELAPVALEPLMIGPVSGTMQIVRLGSSEATNLKLTNGGVATVDGSNPSNSILNQGNLFKQLDPAQILLTSTFDIEVYLWQQRDVNGAAPTKDTINAGKLVDVAWLKIQDCRLTGRSTNISMGQIVNEPVNFQGLLMVPSAIDNNFALDTAIADLTQKATNG
jgi:hypothetical protein